MNPNNYASHGGPGGLPPPPDPNNAHATSNPGSANNSGRPQEMPIYSNGVQAHGADHQSGRYVPPFYANIPPAVPAATQLPSPLESADVSDVPQVVSTVQDGRRYRCVNSLFTRSYGIGQPRRDLREISERCPRTAGCGDGLGRLVGYRSERWCGVREG